ncbi:MAG: hypothetical protein OHK93_000354 [Ramalina farinacea]|uniref:C3H1-type domain-containing protein n=1 Tax=Ramalina farinacea TaxID=258253 RepID=A0AA43QEP4_9LECA|nr:hypothetical protein [Ramalina farinacea]
MPVCRFFQQGNCKFGDQCRFDHPGSRTTNASSRNPFAPLQNPSPSRPRSNVGRGRDVSILPYKLDKELIQRDLSQEERPRWILSAYGPGQGAPKQLFGGIREQSFEEMRLKHYTLALQGQQQQAVQEAQGLVNEAENQMASVLRDVDGAIQYVINGENEHPNRIDICEARGATAVQSQSTNAVTQNNVSFGQPSLGTPAFGQPSAPLTFGRPSAPTFGQPSAPTSAPTFGQPSAPTSAPTFGQPSAPASGPTFGQPAFGPSTSASGASSGQPAFGQNTVLGRPATSFGQPASAFGQLSAPSTFGQPQGSSFSAQPSANPFQKSSTLPQQPAFGQPSSTAQAGAFGRPSALGSSNPFAPDTAPNPPGTNAQNTAAPRNPFAPSTSSPMANPPQASGNPSAQANPAQSTGGFGLPSTTQPRPQAPNVGVQTTGKIRTWKGRPVTYNEDDEAFFRASDGISQRIWFPNGAPAFPSSGYVPDDAYDDDTRERYESLMRTGTFKDGLMPLLPPKREWCNWDL